MSTFRMALVVLALVAGCQNAGHFTTKVEAARQHLRLSEDQKALEVLSVPNDSGAPPEYHYLKAVTLDRLGRSEAATAEIRRATSVEPDNPKYKGFELKLRLFARDRASLDQLIELNDQFASVGPVALYATYAYQAKSVLLETENKPKAAEFHSQRKQQTLATALTLAKDMPEFHRDLITFAMQNQMLKEALGLIDGLIEVDPKSTPARNLKIHVLLQLNESNAAARIAKQLYEEEGRRTAGAEAYAVVLSAAQQSPEHDEEFNKLLAEYRFNAPIMTRYATYLTRSGHILKAFELLDQAMKEQPDKAARQQLAFVSVSLPLEIESPDYAEERLRLTRAEISDPLLIEYFEARILYLKKQHHEAVQKMLNIVAAERKNPGSTSKLATDALAWVRRILADQLIGDQMKNVIDSTQNTPIVRFEDAPAKKDEQPEAAPKPENQPDEKPAPVGPKPEPASPSP